MMRVQFIYKPRHEVRTKAEDVSLVMQGLPCQ